MWCSSFTTPTPFSSWPSPWSSSTRTCTRPTLNLSVKWDSTTSFATSEVRAGVQAWACTPTLPRDSLDRIPGETKYTTVRKPLEISDNQDKKTNKNKSFVGRGSSSDKHSVINPTIRTLNYSLLRSDRKDSKQTNTQTKTQTQTVDLCRSPAKSSPSAVPEEMPGILASVFFCPCDCGRLPFN